MSKSRLRLLGSFARFMRWPKRLVIATPQDESANGSVADPLANVHQTVRNTLPVIEDQLVAIRIIEQSLSGIEEAVGLAWRDRENLTANYYTLLRGVLQILDDCHSLGDNGQEFEVVFSGFERILCEQGVEVIPVTEGQRFQPDSQCCEETEASSEHASGTVLRIVQSGYQRRLPNGSSLVVRPARVVVSRSPENRKELPK
jgi:hypothetical protein